MFEVGELLSRKAKKELEKDKKLRDIMVSSATKMEKILEKEQLINSLHAYELTKLLKWQELPKTNQFTLTNFIMVIVKR